MGYGRRPGTRCWVLTEVIRTSRTWGNEARPSRVHRLPPRCVALLVYLLGILGLMNRLKRHNHTVARVLLKGFAHNSLVRMLRRDGTDRSIPVARAAVGYDFYLFNKEGNKTDAVENWFDTQVESPMGALLPRLRQGVQPATSDVPALAKFVAASLLRTESVRSYMEQIDAHTGPVLLVSEAWKQEGIQPEDLAESDVARWLEIAAEAYQKMEQPLDEARRSRLRTMLRHYDVLTQRLKGWSWTVTTTDSPIFITGDAPVVAFDIESEGFHGIIPPGSPVFMPVSPRSLLVGEEHPLSPGRLLDPKLASLINMALAREAHGAIFCHPSTPLPKNFKLPAHAPTLNAPRVTIARSDPGTSPTFPATYPNVGDSTVADCWGCLTQPMRWTKATAIRLTGLRRRFARLR